MPKGQVSVAVKKDGVFSVVGSGLRIENYLMTPTHNTLYGYELWIMNDGEAEQVDTKTELSIAPDISAFAVPELVWSRLRVKMAKLGPLRKSTSAVIVSGCDRKYSIATLQPTSPLGRVAYSGSTQPGFSGSAYTTGEVTLGMHCHGGTRGGGYEILYLYVRLKELCDSPVEDSEEFFMRQAGYGFDYEQLGTDAVIVRMQDGGYARTRQSILDSMKRIETSRETDWADEVEYDELQDALAQYPESRAIEMVAGFSGEGQGTKRKAVEPSRPSASRSLPASDSSSVQIVPRRERIRASVKRKVLDLQQSNKLLQETNESLLMSLNSLTSQPKPQPRQNGQASLPSGQRPQKCAPIPRNQPNSSKN